MFAHAYVRLHGYMHAHTHAQSHTVRVYTLFFSFNLQFTVQSSSQTNGSAEGSAASTAAFPLGASNYNHDHQPKNKSRSGSPNYASPPAGGHLAKSHEALLELIPNDSSPDFCQEFNILSHCAPLVAEDKMDRLDHCNSLSIPNNNNGYDMAMATEVSTGNVSPVYFANSRSLSTSPDVRSGYESTVSTRYDSSVSIHYDNVSSKGQTTSHNNPHISRDGSYAAMVNGSREVKEKVPRHKRPSHIKAETKRRGKIQVKTLLNLGGTQHFYSLNFLRCEYKIDYGD